MKKKYYSAPDAELSEMWEQAIICDSLSGGIDDYDLVDGYEWNDGVS